jgi:hypothetical protein
MSGPSRLAEGFERLESEADDVGGETQFISGFRIVGIEHLGRCIMRRGGVLFTFCFV